MVIDSSGPETSLDMSRNLLGFRESVMLALGFFPNSMTRTDIYRVYKRAYSQLARIDVVGFDLPEFKIFDAMLRKLHNNNLIQEVYMNQNYGLGLTDAGEAAFDVIIANLQSHPNFNRIINVYDFYRNAPVAYS